MEGFRRTYRYMMDVLGTRLFVLGGTEFTVWTGLYLAVLLVLLVFISRIVKRWLANSVLARGELELGVRQAIATIFQYLFVLIGLIIILSTAGIDLTTLNVLAGAVGIGVGFGLQTITNNFISGLIILFERPIKVGDRIEVRDATGDVVRIGARAITIKTNDNIEIIIPNSEFISSQVINWSHSDRKVRLHIPVGVSYSSNPEEVHDTLLEVAAEHQGILKDPAPDVVFMEFGESSLNFDLRVWTSEFITKPKNLRSDGYPGRRTRRTDEGETPMRLLAPMRLRHRLLPCVLVLTLVLSTITPGQTDTLNTTAARSGAPVEVDGDTLFFIYANLGPFTPQQRVTAINAKLRSITQWEKVDSLLVVESSTGSNIMADTAIIMVVTDDDAALVGMARAELVREYAAILREHIDIDIQRYSTKSLFTSVGIVVGLLLVLGLSFWAMSKLFPILYSRLESWEGKIFRPIRIRSREILSAGSLSAFFTVLAKGIRLAIALTLIYFFLTYTLSIFPWTQRWNVKPVLIGIFLSILTTTAAIVLLRTLNSFFGMLIGKVDGWKGTVIKPVKLKTVEVLSVERIAELIEGAFKILKLLFFAALGYFYSTILFSFFEFTQTWAGTLFGYIINPLWNVITAFIKYLPNLFFVLVIAYVTRYVIKFIKLIFDEIGKGTLALPGFYREWADPTYKIVRFLVLAFAGIVIFPYLPGSDSAIFQGVSVFLGILFSLGSTSAIANVVAGVVLTYMRPFKIGDRVKIADTIGDIKEKTLLVTRVQTIKNVDISIPNAMVLGSHIINFSSSAKNPGLILHTGVTIGYDAPWKTVHELLLAAAGATANILKEPKPFVLQTSLDDFYVSYELNAYTDHPNMMARIYSELHQNIQDKFNEAGVEIMSPHYTAVRDGNQSSIPEDYLPKTYQTPAFRIFPAGNMENKSTKSEQ